MSNAVLKCQTCTLLAFTFKFFTEVLFLSIILCTVTIILINHRSAVPYLYLSTIYTSTGTIFNYRSLSVKFIVIPVNQTTRELRYSPSNNLQHYTGDEEELRLVKPAAIELHSLPSLYRFLLVKYGYEDKIWITRYYVSVKPMAENATNGKLIDGFLEHPAIWIEIPSATSFSLSPLPDFYS